VRSHCAVFRRGYPTPTNAGLICLEYWFIRLGVLITKQNRAQRDHGNVVTGAIRDDGECLEIDIMHPPSRERYWRPNLFGGSSL
jgi:hypothetical protein